jgi:hypothetical protein
MRVRLLISAMVVSVCAACGGGGSSDGTVFQGTLTERGSGHSSASKIVLRHSSGQTIGEVKICILGECSVTDDQGQWGVNVSAFAGGDVAVVLEGHGISTSVSTNLPATAKEVEMDLDHSGNSVTISKLMIDGEDHTAHSHDHE